MTNGKNTPLKDKDDYDIYGWIAPNGQLYRCTCWGHKKYAEDILNTTEWHLEQSGWIKISGDCINGKGICGDLKCWNPQMTQAQYGTCKRIGFTDEDIDYFGFTVIE